MRCNAGELGDAAEQLESNAEEDVEEWMNKHDNGEEHFELIAKLREEVLAEDEGISTRPAATGVWE